MIVTKRTTECQGYVLRRKPMMETSLLVDLFTRQHGLLSAVAKRSKCSKRGKPTATAQLQSFQELSLHLRIKPGLATLYEYSQQPPPRFLFGRALYVGFYMNELLMRLLVPGEAHASLFESYVLVLDALAAASDAEPVLRSFERVLLAAIGHGITWNTDAIDEQPIDPEASYLFVPESGFHKSNESTSNHIPGASIIAIDQGRLETAPLRRAAKNIMRAAFTPHLGSKPLYARTLFSY